MSKFVEYPGLTGIYSATKGTLRCTAIKLRGGSLCLFSPVLGLTDEVKNSLAELGDVSYLLAPNHYHNKGLSEYVDAFPQASLLAPDEAIPRLHKITGLEFQDLAYFEKSLPAHISVINTSGLKTGEIWLRVQQNNSNAWLVVDAFCTMKENAKKSVSDRPQILGTFPRMGVDDVHSYLPWVYKQIDHDKPTLILPCHGSAIESPQLPTKLKQLVRETFE